MEKTTKKKRTQKNRRISIISSTAVLLLLVFGGLYVASRTFGAVPLSNLSDAFASFSVRDDSTFPFLVDASSVERLASVDKHLCVLKADRLDILNKNGNVVQSVRHTYTAPAMDIRNGRILLYDRGGTRYQILSKTKVLVKNGETSMPILTAALSATGKYAIATTADTSKSLLTVYKISGESAFQFKCISEYITDIAFVGKDVAVTACGVRSAQEYARLLLFSLKKTEPLCDFSYADTSLFHIHAGGKAVTAFSRSLLTTVKNKQQQPSIQFGADSLQHYAVDENGRTTLVLLTYGNEHAAKLQGFHKNGSASFEVPLKEKVISAARSESYTCVLLEGKAQAYNNGGTLVGTLTLAEPAQKIAVVGHRMYILFHDRMESFPVSGEHTQVKNS